jgi:hypothetical protein
MINIQVSVGELIDKITILQIKKNKVEDAAKLDKINTELRLLLSESIPYLGIQVIDQLHNDLKNVNLQLWNVEDELRILEKEKSFGERFIELARAVYHLNDERFEIKNKINQLTGSGVQEVKQYVNYK